VFLQGLLDFSFALLSRSESELIEPLVLIRVIAERHSELITQPVVSGLIQFCSELLTASSPSGLYRLTTISMLWTLTIRGVLQPDQFIQQMVDFPIRRNSGELVNCVQSVLQMSESFTTLTVPDSKAIAVKLQAVLSTPRLNIPGETRSAVKQFLETVDLTQS
jgi:hypothetical protein